MHPLFRNPLFQLLWRLWWLPLTVTAVAWGCGGEQYADLAFQLFCAALAFIAGRSLPRSDMGLMPAIVNMFVTAQHGIVFFARSVCTLVISALPAARAGMRSKLSRC